ncbi:hypothetical protein IMZ08_19200 [Bacillus luteolus]|uniref:Uncharacterized protein n=1 Tax=Litchfieldia luteola TaxID=682179 RepID=A0ABR9QPR1_9BACI|nr:hypothetical protein [Cytobacillus luteolus]MBE4910169.1 hypothetical protein [Cytobacillus luteolus]MBP1942265.1 hypothetical protein [Cytobacillus luteolus]
MYRCMLNDEEAIIRLGAKLEKEEMDRTYLYNRVMEYKDVLENLSEDTSIAILDYSFGIIVVDVILSEIPIITVEHIIKKEMVFD